MTPEIHGYAIVSENDRIAGEDGQTPDRLHNDADWAYFQAELDRADLVVLGRVGHEANPNRRDRPRLVLSSTARRIERRPDAWWWNPAAAPWSEACAIVLPGGGRVAVPGGRRVFDLFLAIGYDAFHLSRARDVHVTGGTPLFTACRDGTPAERVLTGRGLVACERRVLDPAIPVELTIWRKEVADGAVATVRPVDR